MSFTQTLTLHTDRGDALTDLLAGWHDEQSGVAPGYRGARLLSDRDEPGRYLLEVDFTDSGAAEQNSGRPETGAWADKLRALTQGDPEYRNYDVTFTTDGGR